MSHNLAHSPVHNTITSLAIANHSPANARRTRFEARARVEARITKLGGFYDRDLRGIRIKARQIVDGAATTQVTVDVEGEDLYALREFLAELPEEAFVRPADPVVKPPRWADNDVIEETTSRGLIYIWTRHGGEWRCPSYQSRVTDDTVEASLSRKYPLNQIKVLRQTSGQDL